MIKADIVENVAKASSLNKEVASNAVDLFFDSITKALSKGERVEFRGFGVFFIKDRKKGNGRDLKTGKAIQIPPGKTVKYRPSIRLQVK